MAVPHVASGAENGGGNNSCAAASGDLPTITSLKVDGVDVPVVAQNGSKPGSGKLYASIDNNNGSGQMNGSDCVYPWAVSLKRDFGNAGPNNGQWSAVAGLTSALLDRAEFVKKFNPSYVETPEVTAATTMVATVSLPASGTYAADKLYWLTSTGPLEGNSPIVRSGNSVTITGHPGMYTATAENWPTGLAQNFNPITADVNTAYGTWPGGSPNGFNDGAGGPGGLVAQYGSRGLSLSYRMTFTESTGKGTVEQKGMWFETVNTPRWSIMYGNENNSPALTFGLGNYHEYYDATNTAKLNTGRFRVMLPDAWALLGFGVTSASDQALIDGAIKVTRSETTGGAATAVLATNIPVPGQGIIVDIGEVSFSTPNFKTAKNSAVTAKKAGARVTLKVKLTAAEAKAYKKLTIFGGTTKLKKIATVKAKKGVNTIAVKYIKKGGYVVKGGTKVLGSATLSN